MRKRIPIYFWELSFLFNLIPYRSKYILHSAVTHMGFLKNNFLQNVQTFFNIIIRSHGATQCSKD